MWNKMLKMTNYKQYILKDAKFEWLYLKADYLR